MKKILLFLLTIISAYSYSQTGCIEGSCDNGYGTYVWESGDKYQGHWTDGVPEGQGIYTFTTGDSYAGNFKANRRDGFGVYNFSDGERYEGYWVAGKQSGHGVLYTASGTLKSGQWNGSECNNCDVIDLASTSDNSSIGSESQSGCSGDCENGYGTYTWGSETQWAGDTYTGWWESGSMSGYGKYTWNSGNTYTGYWKEGKQDGFGEKNFTDGSSTQTGQWADGSFSEALPSSGTCISGNCQNGYGVYIWAAGTQWAGDIYAGYWKNGSLNGWGDYKWHNGDRYIGNWVNTTMDGQGTLYYSTGTKKAGKWSQNVFQGN